VRSTAIAIAPNSTNVFVAFDDGTIDSINMLTGSDVPCISGTGQIVNYLKISSDGTVILSDGLSGTLQLWRVCDGAQLRCLAKGFSTPAVAAFSPNDDMIVCSRPGDNALCEWDMTLPLRLRDAEVTAIRARQQLAKTPSDVMARSALVRWYELRGAYGWANHLMDNVHIGDEYGIAAARSRWQARDFNAAVGDFDVLIRRNSLGLPPGYLQSCRDAAVRGE